MKEEKEKKAEPRYVGIDLGKKSYHVAFVGKGGKVTMSNGKTYPDGRQALYRKLRPLDKVAVEACAMAFIMAKEIQAAVGCRVYVLNPYKLAVIYASMKKTDREDSMKLAHILEDCREERLPEVPVPSDKDMKRRKLLASYRRAQRDRTRDINLLHALFVSCGITTKVRSDLSTAEGRQEAVKELNGIELPEAEYILKCLELCEKRIAELDKEIKAEAAGDEVIKRLQSVPGVGPMVAFAFSAHIDAAHFENAGQVSNCLGLVPRVYMSGQMVVYGHITKRGNSFLRALLVQGAWALIRSKDGGKLKERYEYMTKEKSKSKKKTIVAIARRLAEEMYILMKYGTLHEKRPFTPEKGKAKKLAQVALSA